MQSRPEMVYHVYVTFMEIYNERIFDLLDDISNEEQKTDFAIVDERGLSNLSNSMWESFFKKKKKMC